MSTPSDADRYADVKLDLNCPKCGSGGLIPLGQLDCMLVCYGCRSRFSLERQGLVELPADRLQVQVRSHLSDWKGHEAILQTRSAVFGNWLLDQGINLLASGWGRCALACVAILAVGGSIALGGRSAVEKPPLEIPDSLDGRAKLFSEALVRRDMSLLTRLTDPAQHRALRIWLAHGSGIPQPVEDKDNRRPCRSCQHGIQQHQRRLRRRPRSSVARQRKSACAQRAMGAAWCRLVLPPGAAAFSQRRQRHRPALLQAEQALANCWRHRHVSSRPTPERRRRRDLIRGPGIARRCRRFSHWPSRDRAICQAG